MLCAPPIHSMRADSVTCTWQSSGFWLDCDAAPHSNHESCFSDETSITALTVCCAAAELPGNSNACRQARHLRHMFRIYTCIASEL